jgi:hypothetical protein
MSQLFEFGQRATVDTCNGRGTRESTVARGAHREESAAALSPKRLLRRREKQRESAQPSPRGGPLTAEMIEQLGDGGPWDSDEEFEEFLETLQRGRRAS